MPPPNTSQVIRHWCSPGSYVYQITSAIVNDPSRTIERMVISMPSTDALGIEASCNDCECCKTDVDVERGPQLFQHYISYRNKTKR